MSYFIDSKLKKMSIDSWWRVNAVIIETVRSFEDPVLHHSKWIQCDLLKPITLSLSSHTIQSVNNNPWRHWKDPQTSQVNKCLDIFRKCPAGTKLCTAQKIQGQLITPLELPHSPTMVQTYNCRNIELLECRAVGQMGAADCVPHHCFNSNSV